MDNNNNNIIIQCLLDHKDFFKKKTHLLYPGSLCFPQFFAFSINSILSNIYMCSKRKNMEEGKDIMVICESYFDILQTMINQIYNNYDIKINVETLKMMSQRVKQGVDNIDDNFILLETYLKDDSSIENYRRALLENSLRYHDFKDINELINHLCDRECCVKREEIQDNYPSSEHYLLICTRKNNIKISHNFTSTTHFWGPFYWNIFHTIVEKCDNNNIKDTLLKFIYILPYTLPCSICKNNYIYNNMSKNIDKLVDNYNIDKDIKQLFSKIHNLVNYDTFYYV